MSSLLRLSLLRFSLTLTMSLLVGCPTPIKGAGASGTASKIQADANGGPAAALVALLVAAQANDEEKFKAALSQNFIMTVERMQELSAQKPELKGAFEWSVFLRNFAKMQYVPSEQIINGNNAEVKATDINGGPVRTKMTFEGGRWKLRVPGGMVRTLDNINHFAAQLAGEAPAAEAQIKRGGGGRGGRVKALDATATEAQKLSAVALDAFDLGDLAGAEKLLLKALPLDTESEELTVALGRVQVQLGKGKEALLTFESFLKKHPESAPAEHYLGMAYLMDNRPLDAALSWRAVAKKNPTYGAKFKLVDRAQKAEGMAKAKKPTPMPSSQPGK